MNLLLDTHALLWWLGDFPMEPAARDAISDPDALVAVSAVSIWEAGIKASLGRLDVPGSLSAAVVEEAFEPLAIGFELATRAAALPPHHRDPFDRMLIAQAQAEGLTLVSRDDVFGLYDVPLLRC